MNRVISNFRTLINIRQVSTLINAHGKDVQKRKITAERITLIGTDNSLTITDLPSAQSLSNRRDLKLVKVEDVDTKTRRPVYKLMTSAQYHQEELNSRKEKHAAKEKKNGLKGEKLITISSNIGTHDLNTQINKIGKLLDKRYEVQMIINVDNEKDNKKSELVYSTMENQLKSNGKFVENRAKGNRIIFKIIPMLKNNDTNSNTSNKNGNGPL